jgi:hypothetical protein
MLERGKGETSIPNPQSAKKVARGREFQVQSTKSVHHFEMSNRYHENIKRSSKKVDGKKER